MQGITNKHFVEQNRKMAKLGLAHFCPEVPHIFFKIQDGGIGVLFWLKNAMIFTKKWPGKSSKEDDLIKQRG